MTAGRKPVSPYLDRPRRDLCTRCRERPAEVGERLCRQCKEGTKP